MQEELPAATKKSVDDIRKRLKKLKSYREPNAEDLSVLKFVARESCPNNSTPLSFPNNGNKWKEFFITYRWTALDQGVFLPSNIRLWNVIRKSRLYDVFFDLSAAQKWWKVSRILNDLLASSSPPDASLSSGCRVLLICPDEIAKLITVLRCIEVGTGLASLDHLEHFRAGTHTCTKCNRPSVPICFKNTRSKCLYEPCSRAIISEGNKRKRKRDKQERLAESREKQVIKRSCSRCRCSIRCRHGETEPRKHEETGKLMVNLCWHHRFVNPAVQQLLVHETTGIYKCDYYL